MSHSNDDESGSSDGVNKLKKILLQCISNVPSAGSFATFGTIEDFVLPGISVDPIGIVRLPLSEDDAHALVQVSHQAPSGKGSDKLVDVSVRNIWEIHASKIRFLNENWQCCLNIILEKAATKLEVPGGSRKIRAEFSKMLLFEKGAMFKAHKETEKDPSIFGTLFICLPSEHTGGAVCLQHGRKHAKFETSDSSAFGATFIAWYADVTHEIEPIETGYRWVLTYKLISDSKDTGLSASILDTRTQDFTQALTQWQDLDNVPQFLAYRLGHLYTNSELRLGQLKGDDYHRVLYVAQSCAKHGGFYVLLANMEKQIIYQNHEEEDEPNLYITHIVDLEGFDLSLYEFLYIPEEPLLQNFFYDNRKLNTPYGGEFLGNGYFKITKMFNDSIIVIVPKRSIRQFLFGESNDHDARGESYPHDTLGRLLRRLQERMEKEGDDSTSRELLLQICQNPPSYEYYSNAEKDLHLGHVAVTAVFLRDPSHFSKAVEQTIIGFDKDCYSNLGESICLQDLFVAEDDIIKALQKPGMLYKIYDNLDSFCAGFYRGNPNRQDPLEKRHLKRWVDTIVFKTLNELTKALSEVANALIQIILERGDDKFRQFVLYQGIRVFVGKFLDVGIFTVSLTAELLLHLQDSDNPQTLFESLLQQVLPSAISNFDLQKYAVYTGARHSQDSNTVRVESTQGELRSIRAGPIKAFYERACAQDQGSLFIRKIQTQASKLIIEHSKDFLMSLLEEMMTIVDSSSSESQEFVQSLVTFYITQAVGKEPKKPGNRARPEEEVGNCNVKGRNDCLEIERFWRNPDVKTYTHRPGHIRTQFRYPEYFEINFGDGIYSTSPKTLKWWKEHHKKWEDRASFALETLRKLPQDKLKRCLAHQYDEIMDLRMVKVDDASFGSESIKEVRGPYEVKSVVPQKRSGDHL